MDNLNSNKQINESAENDSWGLEIRTGIGKRVAEEKRIADIKSQEEPLVAKIKTHNAELRRWIKRMGIFTMILLIALIFVGIKSRSTEAWLIVIVLTIGLLLLAKYDNLKRRGILRCKNCGEEFALRDGDSDKKCPYCGQGHSAAYL